MTERGASRRTLICEAALELAARGGNHAVTHQAIDKHLGLPKGSTSYYFRTRHALVSAAVVHLTERSRARFTELLTVDGSGGLLDTAAELVATYLEQLLTTHRRDVAARYALASDATLEPGLLAALAASVFSVPAAVELMTALGADRPEAAARDLIALSEGLLFDHTHGIRAHDDSSTATRRQCDMQEAIALWLRALCTPRASRAAEGA